MTTIWTVYGDLRKRLLCNLLSGASLSPPSNSEDNQDFEAANRVVKSGFFVVGKRWAAFQQQFNLGWNASLRYRGRRCSMFAASAFADCGIQRLQ